MGRRWLVREELEERVVFGGFSGHCGLQMVLAGGSRQVVVG